MLPIFSLKFIFRSLCYIVVKERETFERKMILPEGKTKIQTLVTMITINVEYFLSLCICLYIIWI